MRKHKSGAGGGGGKAFLKEYHSFFDTCQIIETWESYSAILGVFPNMKQPKDLFLNLNRYKVPYLLHLLQQRPKRKPPPPNNKLLHPYSSNFSNGNFWGCQQGFFLLFPSYSPPSTSSSSSYTYTPPAPTNTVLLLQCESQIQPYFLSLSLLYVILNISYKRDGRVWTILVSLVLYSFPHIIPFHLAQSDLTEEKKKSIVEKTREVLRNVTVCLVILVSKLHQLKSKDTRIIKTIPFKSYHNRDFFFNAGSQIRKLSRMVKKIAQIERDSRKESAIFTSFKIELRVDINNRTLNTFHLKEGLFDRAIFWFESLL